MSDHHPAHGQPGSEQWFSDLFRRVQGRQPTPEPLVERLRDTLAGLGRPKSADPGPRPSPDTPEPRSALARGRALLVEGLQRVSASSGTFYVRDPFLDDEFVLLYMPGVKIPEPMHGFLFPASARQAICRGEPEEFFPDAAERLREKTPLALDKMDDGKRILFEGFVRREGVQSSARLLHHDASGVAAALFVNFSTRTAFTEPVRQRIRGLKESLCALLPDITAELLQTNPLPTAQVARILQPVQQLTTFGLSRGWRNLQKCLGSILSATLAAFDIRPETGLGTIHLFDPKMQTLRLAAFQGDLRVDNRDDAMMQSVAEGDGVVAWVALRRRGILIDDLATSPFRQIHRRIRDGVRSQLAVPALAGDRLLGVVNIEDLRPGLFPSTAVRILWYAASHCAIACHLFQQAAVKVEQAAVSDQLLRLCQKAAAAPGDDRSHLDELARVACNALKAALCDIWRFDRDGGLFEPAGSTHADGTDSARPRPHGWSAYIRRTQRPVWITNVQDATHFDVFFWNPDQAHWDTIPPAPDVPRTLNRKLPANVQAELGIPILLQGECIGGAWLKYQTARTPLSSEDMFRITGLAGEAALVLNKQAGGQACSFFPSAGIMSRANLFTRRAAAVLKRLSRS